MGRLNPNLCLFAKLVALPVGKQGREADFELSQVSLFYYYVFLIGCNFPGYCVELERAHDLGHLTQVSLRPEEFEHPVSGEQCRHGLAKVDSADFLIKVKLQPQTFLRAGRLKVVIL